MHSTYLIMTAIKGSAQCLGFINLWSGCIDYDYDYDNLKGSMMLIIHPMKKSVEKGK